jgi:hypothetical protein
MLVSHVDLDKSVRLPAALDRVRRVAPYFMIDCWTVRLPIKCSSVWSTQTIERLSSSESMKFKPLPGSMTASRDLVRSMRLIRLTNGGVT